MSQTYTLTVGLEIHTQLKTQSKVFCADPNLFGARPNTLVSPVSLGHPGTLPVFNEKVAELAIRLGLAFGCNIRKHSAFDRKNYFYPDLPKGYQITQDRLPICVGGEIRFRTKEGEWKSTKLNRIHIEEDAGKSLHADSQTETNIDLNRAGVPLLEIVTEPVITSASDAAACLMEVRKLVRFLEVGDGNMEEGSFRCDANISIRPEGQEKLGNKVEIKNMNSFKHVQKSIDYEFQRQSQILNSGGEVVSETRMFDVLTGETYGMRSKETLNDYRYFPDPDLAPLQISEDWLNSIRSAMPELPNALFSKYTLEYGLPDSDSLFLTESKSTVSYFEGLLSENISPKQASNWIMTTLQSALNDSGLELDEFSLRPGQLAPLIQLVDSGKVSHSVAVQILFPALVHQTDLTIEEFARQKNLILDSDEGAVRDIVKSILADFPEKVKEYKSGKKALLGMFMGELRKKSDARTDPKLVSKVLEEELNR
jgi:aspartyl-tRNA(Asn)/glutamyl-tRNA(Gln) amidotransferase subunit B